MWFPDAKNHFSGTVPPGFDDVQRPLHPMGVEEVLEQHEVRHS